MLSDRLEMPSAADVGNHKGTQDYVSEYGLGFRVGSCGWECGIRAGNGRERERGGEGVEGIKREEKVGEERRERDCG